MRPDSMTSSHEESEAYRARAEAQREAVRNGIVVRAVVCITFPSDEPGDDPLRSLYSPYDVERDIEGLLSTQYGRGLEHTTLKVECVDAEYGRTPAPYEEWVNDAGETRG